MKLICIDNSPINGRKATLTYGKEYTPLNIKMSWDSVGVQIENDIGEEFYYHPKRFCTIQEWRDNKINKILLETEN